MSKIVVLEWDTRVTETHRAEVAFDRLPKAVQEAIGKCDIYDGAWRAYLPDIEGSGTLTETAVTERDLYRYGTKDE